MSFQNFVIAEPVGFDPGIPGFVKASRHHSGPALVMTRTTLAKIEWAGVFWVKRLIHNAGRYAPQYFRVLSEATWQAVDRHFDYMLASGPPPIAKRDAQKLRVYDWEDDNIFPEDRRPMPWSGCIFYAKYVWERVGDGKPLILSNESKAQSALSLGGKIHIPSDIAEYRTRPTILHEIAHELTEHDQHGPAFVSTYMDLCVRFLGLDREKLEKSAIRYGVNFLE